jgi:undecaprenyl diphosphate synthase
MSQPTTQNSSPSTPSHIAIIMDGNRRWAKKQGKSVLVGHQYVADVLIEQLIDRGIERGVKYLTFWAWSTENWNRPKPEVIGIMRLFRHLLRKNIERLHKKGVKVAYIGDLTKFSVDIQRDFEINSEKTRNNNKITAIFALNYGGRDEIVRAVNKIIEDKGIRGKGKENITESDFAKSLDTNGVPDPEMIIRTGGEKRLSGFLLWQSEYAELYFTDVLMPDFSPDQLDLAIEDFGRRQRRFGK